MRTITPVLRRIISCHSVSELKLSASYNNLPSTEVSSVDPVSTYKGLRSLS